MTSSLIEIMAETSDSSHKYTELVAGLEAIAAGAPEALLSDEPLRKRLLDAAKAVIPAIEDKDDAAQRLFYTVSSFPSLLLGC